MKKYLLPWVIMLFSYVVSAQSATELLQKVRTRLDQVNDYQATGTMKTNVSFLKEPEANVQVYFKKPDKLKIKNEKGISFVPKGAVTVSLNNLLKGAYTVLDAGADTANGQKVRLIKLLPQDENADLVLSTLYIDEQRLLVLRARTTTRDNGTYEVDMRYGKYIAYALPDKVIFTFNVKNYKLPKGSRRPRMPREGSSLTIARTRSTRGCRIVYFNRRSDQRGPAIFFALSSSP
jgi:hypothetical protein